MQQSEKTSFNLAAFVRDVRREAQKVTWPTRKETMMSLMMVLILAAIAAVFFLIVDGLIGWVVGKMLGIGG